MWVDNDGSRRVLNGVSDEAMKLVSQATTSATSSPDTTAVAGCPVCREPMSETRVDGADVSVDVCSAHGTWFDRHELFNVAELTRKKRAPRPAPAPSYSATFDEPMEPIRAGFSTWAIVGFVLSFFCGILGLIFSWVGFNECSNSGGRIGGQGLAIAGMVISLMSMLIVFASAC